MSRLELHEILLTFGARKVYFQPPETVKIEYPCIIYQNTAVSEIFADDHPYSIRKAYTVTVIDANPDSEIPDKVSMLSLTKFATAYQADNLNHWLYTVYY